jgi:hypothetical protein
VLPGGRNFDHKAQKVPGKVKFAGHICCRILTNFSRIIAEKGEISFHFGLAYWLTLH